MSLREPSSKQVEDLNTLFPELRSYSVRHFRCLGCIYPEQCGTDVVTKYLFDRKPKVKGRSEIVGELVTLDFPNAKNQLSVLHTCLKYEVQHRHSHCKDCKHKNDFCGIAADSPDDEENEPRITQAVLCSPVNPLQSLEAKELLEQSLASIPNLIHRQYVIGQAEGKTCAEMGRESMTRPSTVRQALRRAKLRMASSVGIQTFRRRRK
jgi:DNA-binding CsgD family transcriptional regulator